MPTPALPLLHQLLQTLHIPIHPPTLSSVSPSLLLLILESLLSQRLQLPKDVRLCATINDEISVIKCLLGVLADDLLGIDLTLVDPRKVVDGSKREIEVVIMALVVVAKRKGIDLKPKEIDWFEEEGDGGLQEPMIPDISFSSIGSGSGDVFASSPTPVSRNSRQSVAEVRDDSGSAAGTSKTVLDEILEEFGV